MSGSSRRDIEIFTEASQLPTEVRSSFLDRVCAGNQELRRRIDALLMSNDRAGSFLEQPVGNVGEARSKPGAVEKPGDLIGRYKLLEQIGEGGCGVVFVAEQKEPVQRRVALKVVKPGMDTKNVIARFEAERQALAMMDHPNIAHVFDAGTTESARPYFVMELVDGVKITDYCDRNSLTTNARLELVVQVCEAIQHAHQKGIIHRDIKPSNILVTNGANGKPAVKVIDFGIAKAIGDHQLTEKTIFTSREMLIGTPAYMSPEQAALTNSEMDTRTDIYSLGVLLYELLTGTTPFDTRELLKAGFDEVRRVIRNEEPLRPSTRLSTMISADLVNFSKHHGADAPKLIRETRGDLDWIVMKALEKDRGRRFQTANALAEDIRRHLDDEAIYARPPSQLYKFQKLVARNRLWFGALAVVMVALLAGLAIAIWSLAKERSALREAEIAQVYANEQRKKAELGESKALTETARSREITDFFKQVVFGAHPNFAQGRDTSFSRELLELTAKSLDVGLTNQPAARAELKMWIGGLYLALGQGATAEKFLQDALAYYRASLPGTEKEISDTLYRLSLLHITMQPPQLDFAEQEIKEALDIENKFSSNPTIRALQLRTRLGYIRLRSGQFEAAEDILRKVLEDGKPFEKTMADKLIDTRGALATVLYSLKKYDDAEKLIRKSLEIDQKFFEPEHPYIANDMFRLASVLEMKNEFEEAETFGREVVARRLKSLGPDHPGYDEALVTFGTILVDQKKWSQSADTYHDLLNVRRKKFGDKDARVLDAVELLTGSLAASRDETRFTELAGQFPEAWEARAAYLARRNQWPEALAAGLKLVEVRPDDHSGYHLVAPLLIQMRDQRAYENICASISTRFAGATNIYTADRMAKDCLIVPRPGADLKVPVELAEIAVSHGTNDSGALPFFQFCKALSEYRLGHWSEASTWAKQAAGNSFPYARAEAHAILAMSCIQMNQPEESRMALQKCNKILDEELPKFADEDLGRDWRDLIIAHTLRAEAKQMVDSAPPSAIRRSE